MADAPQVAFGDGRLELLQRSPDPPQAISHASSSNAWPKETSVYYEEAHTPKPENHNILGIQQRNFWILSLVALVLIGATIGGSVGGSLAIQNRKSSVESAPQNIATSATSPSPTTEAPTSATPYKPLPPSEVPLIDVSCPETLTAWNDDEYWCYENTNAYNVGDITGIVAYSLQDCINACSTMNKVMGIRCTSVVIGAELSREIGNDGANCWLKNTSMRKQEMTSITLAKLVPYGIAKP